MCSAEIEEFPEITCVYVTRSNLSITNTTFHSCVLLDASEASGTATINKITFTPPLGSFDLLQYSVEGSLKRPIRGFYQMKLISANQAKFLLQLKIDPEYKNEFAYFNVEIPFFNSGIIVDFQSAGTIGVVTIAEDQHSLLWRIGTKFSTRNMEVALPVEVTFDPSVEHSGEKDPFCSGTTAYAKVIRLHASFLFFLLIVKA